ncbi:HNH endonuclease [Paenibacillus sp. P96]|uniref:HNH endonuclease n=2 Tax=Paenibacillus zeirhizosphaerae TaxID=2987519 RepID=A0ABT9FND5_9BACL|nr:HNH endonuclease [Paenibacillus sp. P96]MDP4096244.1 HNH endonuclease [Paenibacillus sp. P96]
MLKYCNYCKEYKPLAGFQRRTGRKSGPLSRRGACRDCRHHKNQAAADKSAPDRPQAEKTAPRALPVSMERRQLTTKGGRAQLNPDDAAALRPNRNGMIRLRGKTDKGRRWNQEIDPELAVTLVKEHMAVVVNRSTIRRLYTNREFRRYIMMRDKYTCYFCGNYGDTLDHLLPRAKGGHTTPVNCVCACNECNQSKADRDVDEFIRESVRLT